MIVTSGTPAGRTLSSMVSSPISSDTLHRRGAFGRALAAVVVAGIVTYAIAARTENALVVDNYYKEGLAINAFLFKEEHHILIHALLLKVLCHLLCVPFFHFSH